LLGYATGVETAPYRDGVTIGVLNKLGGKLPVEKGEGAPRWRGGKEGGWGKGSVRPAVRFLIFQAGKRTRFALKQYDT